MKLNPYSTGARGVPLAGDAKDYAAFAVATLLAVGILVCLMAFWIAPVPLLGALCALVALVVTATLGEWALLAVLVLRPILLVFPDLPIAGQQIGVDGILNLMVTAGLLLLIPFRKHPPVARPYTWIAAAFLVVGFLSLAQSTNPLLGFRQWFRMLGYGVFFWVAYTAVIKDERFSCRLKAVALTVAVVLLLMGACQMLLLLRQLSLGDYIRVMMEPGLEHRLDGFQDYPHTYANMLLVVTPILLLGAWSNANRGKRYLFYGVAIACMGAIVYTGVRSAMLALAVTLTVFLVGTRRYRQLAVLGALLVVAGVGTGVFQARLDAFLNPGRSLEWTSLADRREIWYAIDAGIAERPVTGHGLGAVSEFISASPLRHTTKAHSSHCDYRKFLFEMGLPGGALYVLLWISVTWSAWRKRDPATFTGHLCAAVAAVACGVLTIALVDEVMQDYAAMVLYWTLAGAALGLAGPARTAEEVTSLPAKLEGEESHPPDSAVTGK
jgi:O-antigen ligase